MAFEGLGGNPWNLKIQLSEDPEYIPVASARGAFQVVNSGTLFALFGLTCFMRYGIPCVARRGRFQGEVYHFKTLSFAMITYAM